MGKDSNQEKENGKNNQKKRKYDPYRKDKHTISKIREYENYLANIERMIKEKGMDI